MLFMANGDRLEISYENGVVHGNATIKGRYRNMDLIILYHLINLHWKIASYQSTDFHSLFAGSNGDKETCIFVNGAKHGPATYYWKAGHR